MDVRSKKLNYLFILTAFAFILISVFLHFYSLSSVPNGFFCDESAIGYNAWSILETGRDEYGTSYPLFFRCFDNYHDPVMVYTLVPLIKIFGLSKWIVRFPSTVYMLLASLAFYFLSYHFTRGKYLSLCAAFVFSILPWAFPLSRTTMSGYTPMLLGMTAGWLFLMKAFAHKSAKFAAFSALGWALAMYSHNCGRPMTAVLLVCFFAASGKGVIRRWRTAALFSILFVALMLPMIFYVLYHPESMSARFQTISVWRDFPGIPETLKRIAVRYLEYFSPVYLFLTGGTTIRHNTGLTGVLFISLLPGVLAGLYRCIKYFSRNYYYRCVMLGIAVYPAAAVLTIDHYHSTRSLNGMVFWAAAAVIGFDLILKTLRHSSVEKTRLKNRLAKFAILVSSSAALIEVPAYFADYFSESGYIYRSRLPFSAPLTESLEYAFAHLKQDELLYISKSVCLDSRFHPSTYAQILFFGKIPPATYQKYGIPQKKIMQYNGRIPVSGILVRSTCFAYIDPRSGVVLKLNTEPIPENSRLLTTVPFSKKTGIDYQIYRVTPKRKPSASEHYNIPAGEG